jgi:hypothetical protein
MNDILSKVTPLTRGIIWLRQGEFESGSTTYKSLDYLLNGLLSAGIKNNPDVSSHVMVSSNFHFPIHLFMVKELDHKEYESYLKLFSNNLTSENNILVIDETEGFQALLSKTPQEIKSLLHLSK